MNQSRPPWLFLGSSSAGLHFRLLVIQWYTIVFDVKTEAAVIKNLVKHGNSWALVIDRPILDLLKLNPEQPVELSTDGKSMTISPIGTSDRVDKVRTARKKVNARYRKAFQRLAE